MTTSTAAWNASRESSGSGEPGGTAPWNWNVSVAGRGQSAQPVVPGGPAELVPGVAVESVEAHVAEQQPDPLVRLPEERHAEQPPHRARAAVAAHHVPCRRGGAVGEGDRRPVRLLGQPDDGPALVDGHTQVGQPVAEDLLDPPLRRQQRAAVRALRTRLRAGVQVVQGADAVVRAGVAAHRHPEAPAGHQPAGHTRGRPAPPACVAGHPSPASRATAPPPRRPPGPEPATAPARRPAQAPSVRHRPPGRPARCHPWRHRSSILTLSTTSYLVSLASGCHTASGDRAGGLQTTEEGAHTRRAAAPRPAPVPRPRLRRHHGGRHRRGRRRLPQHVLPLLPEQGGRRPVRRRRPADGGGVRRATGRHAPPRRRCAPPCAPRSAG